MYTDSQDYNLPVNDQMVKSHRMGFLFAVENNRHASIEKGEWSQVKSWGYPEGDLRVRASVRRNKILSDTAQKLGLRLFTQQTTKNS